MPKKAIIITSVGAVLLGIAAFGIVFTRTRMLSDMGSAAVTALTGSGEGASTVSDGDTMVPEVVFVCGDGVCSEGERNCSIDCGSGEAYFRASVVIEPISSTSVKVKWKTRNASTGAVIYGMDSSASEGKVDVTDPDTAHEVTVDGLSLEKNYYFGISVSEDGGGSYMYGPYPCEGAGPQVR